jgi:tetratricopeptide (TPR) repeat protein
VAACRRLFLQELGTEPSPSVRRAADVAPPSDSPSGDRTAARAHLEAGEAAVAAGAMEHGLTNLRQACDQAAGSDDRQLHARCLGALGTALVHAVRGRDEEGAAVLAQALSVAEEAADRETLVMALRELAFADLLVGRRARVEERLTRANRIAGNNAEHASVLAVRGVNRLDMGDYKGGLASLEEAIGYARRDGDPRRIGWCLTSVARARLGRGEIDEAAEALDQALELIEGERWLAFLPYPEALRGEIDLIEGDTAAAAERFEHAFTLACQIGDPCWEGLAARNLGLLHMERGEQEPSQQWMNEARTRCTRLPDRYVWMQGHILDSSIQVAIETGDLVQARQLIRSLRALASRTEMRELVVRALIHASRLGEDGALESARLLARDIDNPTLTALLTEPIT